MLFGAGGDEAVFNWHYAAFVARTAFVCGGNRRLARNVTRNANSSHGATPDAARENSIKPTTIAVVKHARDVLSMAHLVFCSESVDECPCGTARSTVTKNVWCKERAGGSESACGATFRRWETGLGFSIG